MPRKDKRAGTAAELRKAVMHDRPDAQLKEKRATALLPPIASRHSLWCPQKPDVWAPRYPSSRRCVPQKEAKEKANNKEKIKDAKDDVDLVTLKIAARAQPTTEAKNLEKKIANHKDMLDKDEAIREKKPVEFKTAEKDLLEPTGSLKTAASGLSRRRGTSRLRGPGPLWTRSS